MTGNPGSALSVDTATVNAATVLTAHGTLDSSTYQSLRDRIIKAALDEPKGVIIDVTHLDVPSESAWAAFTSAHWHTCRWPEVPIMLVCEHLAGRSTIARSGVSRYVPVYPAVSAAIDALPHAGSTLRRRRARAELPAELRSLRRARDLVAEWLTEWSHTELVPVTKVVVTAFVENVLQHTESRPILRLESDGSAVTVAVEDASHNPAGLREGPNPDDTTSGLRIVSALCRTWGNSPTPSGKTVWAVIGPENRL